MKVAINTFTGDGVDNSARVAHGLGATPNFVIHFGITSGGSGGLFFKTSDMGSAESVQAQSGNQYVSDGIKALDATNVKFGTSWPANRNGYDYITVSVLFESNDGDPVTGTCTNVDNKSWSHSVAGTVEAIFAAQNWNGGPAMGVWHTRVRGASTDASTPHNAAAEAADYIQDIAKTASTFEVGLSLNTSTNTFYSCVFEQDTTCFYTDTYTGNGVGSSRNITLSQSWAPSVVLIKGRAATKCWIWTSSHAATYSTGFESAQATNGITAVAAGQITIDGSNADLNTNTASYDVIYFRQTPAPAGGFRSRIAGGFVVN